MKDPNEYITIDTKALSQHDSGFLLWQLTHHWQKETQKALQISKITHVQLLLLDSLVHMESKKLLIHQVSLSEFARCDKMMVSKVLRAMEQKKWIKRKEQRADKRAMSISLTQEGKRVHGEALALYHQLPFHKLALLPKAEKLSKRVEKWAKSAQKDASKKTQA